MPVQLLGVLAHIETQYIGAIDDVVLGQPRAKVCISTLNMVLSGGIEGYK